MGVKWDSRSARETHPKVVPTLLTHAIPQHLCDLLLKDELTSLHTAKSSLGYSPPDGVPCLPNIFGHS